MSRPPSAVHSNSPSDFLRLWARQRPDAPFVIDAGAGRTVSFAEADQRVDRLARVLLGGGLLAGDRVGVLADDCPDYLGVILACIRSGMVAVPLGTNLTDQELNALLMRAGPRRLFVGEPYRVAAGAVAAGVASVGSVLCFGSESYEELLATQPTVSLPPWVHTESTACLCFTSGTTGAAKGVEQSIRMLAAMTWAATVDGEVRPDDVRYSGVALHRTVGLVHALVNLSLGIPTVLLPAFDAEAVLELVAGAATACVLTTGMLRALVDAADRRGRGARLRTVVYGSEPATVELLRRAEAAFGCGFVRTFGATTEAGTQCRLSSAEHRRALAGEEDLLDTVGGPSFGVDLRVVDGHLRDVPAGSVGEIATRSAQTMTTYLGQPDLTAEAFRAGWFRAGDLGRLDERGMVHLVGRAQEVIVRDGETLFPVDIEAVLATHPAVREAAVLGLADERLGQAVHAWVVVDQPVDEGELRAFCRGRLRPEQIPDGFHPAASLPRNGAGKVLKRVLRAAGAVPAP